MKRLSLCLLLILLSASCKNTWDSEARDLFTQGCLESAKESNMSEAAAKSMCDCRLEKVMAKYPNFSDAMEHTNEMMSDPELKDCK